AFHPLHVSPRHPHRRAPPGHPQGPGRRLGARLGHRSADFVIKPGPRGNTGLVMSGAQQALASMFFAGTSEALETSEVAAPTLAPADERRFRQIVGANLDF